MLNHLWGAMILIGVVYGILTGDPAALTDGILNGAGDAVSLCITMAGVMAFWCGIMEVAEKAGLVEKITRLLRPFVEFLFPGIPKGHKARDEISTNITANILGLGWAATPAGLKAMKSLEELEEERRKTAGQTGAGREQGRSGAGLWGRISPGKRVPAPRGTASREMCTFLILNISSLQLIPVNMIAYRSQYGAADPAGIVAPAIIATAVSTLAAVIFCKAMDRRR